MFGISGAFFFVIPSATRNLSYIPLTEEASASFRFPFTGKSKGQRGLPVSVKRKTVKQARQKRKFFRSPNGDAVIIQHRTVILGEIT